MSASTERKLRQAARAAGTDKKSLAAQEEAARKKKSNRRWTLGTIAVVLLIAAILFLDSGFLYTHTTALTIGDESYSPAQVNYRYANEYFNLVNQYGSYASIFGLNTSSGIAGLSKTDCPMLENGTWKDYFLQTATDGMVQVKALTDYAKENGIALTDEEKAEIEDSITDLETLAKQQGYSNASNLLGANYGNGVTTAVMREASLASALASKAYSDYNDSLTYSADELEEYYQSFEGERDYFAFLLYDVTAATEDDGDDATEDVPTEDALAEAHADAAAIVAAYVGSEEEPVTDVEIAAEPEVDDAAEVEAATETEPAEETEDAAEPEEAADADEAIESVVEAESVVEVEPEEAEPVVEVEPVAAAPEERFAAAVDSLFEGETPTSRSSVLGSSLSENYKEWMMDESRVAGDVTVVDTDTGSTVVVFLSRDDNHYATANIRHILVRAEASEDGTYSEEALAAAKARAEEILAEFEAGDQTEESFAALAEQYSEDSGSNTNGGLYENVPQGQMVEEFDNFLFDGHKSGDTGIVYGESASYAGYHVMYYVGEGEQYSDLLAETSLRSEELNTWLEELTSSYEAVRGSGFRWVG